VDDHLAHIWFVRDLDTKNARITDSKALMTLPGNDQIVSNHWMASSLETKERIEFPWLASSRKDWKLAEYLSGSLTTRATGIR
jgi:hypothetical protein